MNAGRCWQASWFLKVRVALELSISLAAMHSIFLFPFQLKCSRKLDSFGAMETQDKKVMSAEGGKLRSKDHRCEGVVAKIKM